MWLICIKYALFNDNDNINNNHYHSTFKRASILIKLTNVFLCDLDHIKSLCSAREEEEMARITSIGAKPKKKGSQPGKKQEA
ncbi:hypothetical protein NB724_000187 [Pantoea ananatis]|nr:hypothetical protein [Pantoea ananatis]MCW0333395.1 hypothetical protein [Pantoea ananatis]MCW0381355.1 hypothetical protein [Pantoea ananatis]MCW0406020.1 hypothetical protein [Pantoea ananatis]MCW0426194.1 hypothetical protein [Pantoea ananatis]